MKGGKDSSNNKTSSYYLKDILTGIHIIFSESLPQWYGLTCSEVDKVFHGHLESVVNRRTSK